MALLRKISAVLTGYLVLYAEVSREILRIFAEFFRDRWRRFLLLPGSEKIFAGLTAALMIFTFLPWRSYRIQFGEDMRRHGIYSDDFAIILIGCMIAGLCLVWHLFPRMPRKLQKPLAYRYAGIIVVTVFALWNLINPHRIAATNEATFTWSFYVFETMTVLWIIAGILGGRYYAQYPERN